MDHKTFYEFIHTIHVAFFILGENIQKNDLKQCCNYTTHSNAQLLLSLSSSSLFIPQNILSFPSSALSSHSTAAPLSPSLSIFLSPDRLSLSPSPSPSLHPTDSLLPPFLPFFLPYYFFGTEFLISLHLDHSLTRQHISPAMGMSRYHLQFRT